MCGILKLLGRVTHPKETRISNSATGLTPHAPSVNITPTKVINLFKHDTNENNVDARYYI